MPDDYVVSFAIDDSGNKWIGTDGCGLAVYNESGVVSVEDNNNFSISFSLSQNYLNPFNPSTTIDFSSPQRAFVTLKIYSILGETVADLVSEELSAGHYSIPWDAASLSSGVYFYRLETQRSIETKKLILVK